MLLLDSYQHIRSPISDSSYYLLWATASTLLSPQLRNSRVKEEQPNCRKQTLYSRSTTHRKVFDAIIDSIGWSSRWCMDANRGPITAHKSAVIRPHLADVRTYPGVISDTGIISANCRAAFASRTTLYQLNVNLLFALGIERFWLLTLK